MALDTHGERKYQGTTQLIGAAHFPNLRIERRYLEAGHHQPGICQSNELVFVISGQTVGLQSANGVTFRRFIQPGISCVCPVGTFEKASGTTSPIECLHLYLPPSLIERSALADYEIDPGRAELRYTGGMNDAKLYRMAMAFNGVLQRPEESPSRLFLDGLQATLAAYLLEKYSVDRWKKPKQPLDLGAKRLERALDYIESHFSENPTLAELSAESGLSDYHFYRLFYTAMGISPHRYVLYRKVQEAQKHLERSRSPLAEIAVVAGFESQAEFNQTFRHMTRLTPRRYRELRQL